MSRALRAAGCLAVWCGTAALRLEPPPVYADGVASASVLDGVGRPVPVERLRLEAGGCRLGSGRSGAILTVASRAGECVVSMGGESLRVELLPDERDTDADGYPDGAELGSLEEQQRFVDWFCSVAESQFYSLSSAWIPEHRDCAGLLRFAYVEALKRHDRAWFERFGFLVDAASPDVSRFEYPAVPLLGTSLFRLESGAYQAGEAGRPGAFGAFASAAALRDHACRFVGRDLALARRGDLLFFTRQAAAMSAAQPDHSMIYLGPGRDGSAWVVYHTGRDAQHPGEVRRVRVKQLLEHPDRAWRPIQSNPNFLGVYRWKILGLDP